MSEKPENKGEVLVHLTVTDPNASVEKKPLPKATVEKMPGEEGFKVRLQKIRTDLLRDQHARLMDGQGCISTPTGPTC